MSEISCNSKSTQRVEPEGDKTEALGTRTSTCYERATQASVSSPMADATPSSGRSGQPCSLQEKGTQPAGPGFLFATTENSEMSFKMSRLCWREIMDSYVSFQRSQHTSSGKPLRVSPKNPVLHKENGSCQGSGIKWWNKLAFHKNPASTLAYFLIFLHGSSALPLWVR